MSTFPNQIQNRAAAVIAQTARLVSTAHQRLNTVGSQVSALTPGSWELLTLSGGWSNVPGYIPAQVRILQAGMAQLVGHIEGGATSGTIGTLTAGFYNPVHSHAFTANVLAGASAVSVSGTVSGSVDTGALNDGTISGFTQNTGVADGTTNGSSAAASGPGSHSHGSGSYALTSGLHSHAGNTSGGSLAVTDGTHQHTSSALVPATPVNYNTVILSLSTSGALTIQNCPASATQLSFNENLPLVTS